MDLKRILTVLSVVALVIFAFHLGQRTQVSSKTKPPVKKEASAKARTKKKAVTAAPVVAAKPTRGAKAVIVIDDFGYNTNNIEALFDIGLPVTLSILPNLPYSGKVADIARSRGYETILHLPLESLRKDVREEPVTIRSGDSEKTVAEKLDKDIRTVPGIRGVSNHTGSKATEDPELMSKIFANLKKRGLYFFDSLTSEKSVCREIARSSGIRFAKRDMFLDNSDNFNDILGELASFKKMVLKRSRAIAVCHDRKNTIKALAAAMPDMAEEGIEFVNLSELVR